MQTAIDADMAVINADGTKNYVDNEDENIIEQPAQTQPTDDIPGQMNVTDYPEMAPTQDAKAALFS